MGLVVFWLIASHVRVHVEGFLVVAVDDASDCVFGVGPSVGLEGGFVEVVLIFGVGEGAGVWLQVVYVLDNLFPVLFLLLVFLFELPLPNSISDLGVLIFSFDLFLLGVGRPRSFLCAEGGILRDICFFVGDSGVIEFGFVEVGFDILLGIEGNVFALLEGGFFLLGRCTLLGWLTLGHVNLLLLGADLSSPGQAVADAGGGVAEMVEMLPAGLALVGWGRPGTWTCV